MDHRRHVGAWLAAASGAVALALLAALGLAALALAAPAASLPSMPAPQSSPGNVVTQAVAAAVSTTLQAQAVIAPLGVLASDSEVVYGPTLFGFDVSDFVNEKAGYLSEYGEIVDGTPLSGAQIVSQVADAYSVGPRVLLALIEAHSGWVTQPQPELSTPLDQPAVALSDALALAADSLNAAYYGHKYGSLDTIDLADGTTLQVPDVSSGTFAVLAATWRGATRATWGAMEGPSRFAAAWTSLFGDPYSFVVPAGAARVVPNLPLSLPFAADQTWYYTAGPHSPWGMGAARAAVDFAPPPAEATGCFPSVMPVLAVAAGKVVSAEASGLVVDPDLDGDDYPRSGLVLVYVHLGSAGRAPAGAEVAAGDAVGFPSCEGGVPTQTRMSVARRFDGEWLPADAPDAPLLLGGWAVIPGPTSGAGYLAAAGMPVRTASPSKSDAVNGVAHLR